MAQNFPYATIKLGINTYLGELGGVCFFYLMLNRTFFEFNAE